MDFSIILAIAAAAASVVSAIATLLQRFFKQKEKGKEPTLQDRISNLTKSLESSAAVITEIEVEISKRKNLAQQLEEDIERYNRLRELNQTQVEAIAQTLRMPLVKESRKSLVLNGAITFIVALIFFAVGFFAGGR